MDIEIRERLTQIIKELTETGEWQLDKDKLKILKRICKQDNLNIEIVYELLTAQIHRKHAQIRYSCLQIYEELFQRSNYFRILVTNDFPDFVQLSVGIKSYELPPPPTVAKKLRQYAIALIKNWFHHFGDHFRPLGIGYDYLEHNGFIRDDNQSLQNIHYYDRIRSDKEARMKAIEERRFDQIKTELNDQLELLQETIRNMETCFEILIPKNADDSSLDFEALLRGDRQSNRDNDTSTNRMDYKDAIVSHGLGSNRYSITITMSSENPLEDQVHESDENKILYDQLREGYKLLETKQIKQVNSWMKSLVRMEHIDKKEKETIMKQLINIKSETNEIIRKVKLLGIELPIDHNQFNDDYNNQDDDDDDDEFMDEIFEDIELPDISQPSTSKDHSQVSNASLPPSQRLFPLSFEPYMTDDVTYNGPQIQNVSLNNNKNDESSDNGHQNLKKGKGKQIENNLRKELLKKAPVVEWGDDLYYWDKKNVPFNTSGIEFSHRFMGTGEGANEMPDQLLEDLRKRAIYYKSDVPNNLKACRYPLNKGGLCPRHDLVTCPFHGKIIPRDEYGQPISVNNEPTTTSSSSINNNDNNTSIKNIQLSSSPPKDDYWQEIEDDVMKQLGKDKIESNKKRQRKNNESSSKKKSSLINIHKKPDTPYTRLNKKIDSKESRLMVEEALEYERSMKARDRKVSTWRQ